MSLRSRGTCLGDLAGDQNVVRHTDTNAHTDIADCQWCLLRPEACLLSIVHFAYVFEFTFTAFPTVISISPFGQIKHKDHATTSNGHIVFLITPKLLVFEQAQAPGTDVET
jgi:hypothetical protein